MNFKNFGRIDIFATLINNNLIDNVGEIEIDGELINNGAIDNFGVLRATETDIVNRGTINNHNTLDFVRSTLINEGRFLNLSDGKIDLDFAFIKNTGYFENNGLIQENDFGEVPVIEENNGLFINNGELDRVSLDSNAGVFVNRGFHDTNGVTAENYIIEDTGVLLNNGFTIVKTDSEDDLPGFDNRGLLKGSGEYATYDEDIAFTLGPGTVAPGGIFDDGAVIDTAGTLTFNGDVVLDAGSLDFSIGGFEAETFDILNVLDGKASLSGGVITFSLLDGFDIASALNPGETKSFTFLKAENGILDFTSDLDFSQIQTPGISFDVVQQDDELIFSATRADALVPEVKLEKLINGGEADTPDEAIEINPGDIITYRFEVSNTGETEFEFNDVTLIDDQVQDIIFESSSDVGSDGILSQGETWVYTTAAIAGDLSQVIDFEQDGTGNTLQAGDLIDDDFIELGLMISTPGSGFGAMIFDSANPTGGDVDLGTPTQPGGPGIGTDAGGGIGNTEPQGNVLIISEDGDQSDPDDNAGGGVLRFEWDSLVRVTGVNLLDIDLNEQFVTVETLRDSNQVNSYQAQNLGDNSYQELQISGDISDQLDINLVRSGAVTGLSYIGFLESTATVSVDLGDTIIQATDQAYYTNPV